MISPSCCVDSCALDYTHVIDHYLQHVLENIFPSHPLVPIIQYGKRVGHPKSSCAFRLSIPVQFLQCFIKCHKIHCQILVHIEQWPSSIYSCAKPHMHSPLFKQAHKKNQKHGCKYGHWQQSSNSLKPKWCYFVPNVAHN